VAESPVPGAETFVFTSRLREGTERGYEEFHRAIPASLDEAMRAAGILAWRIFRNGRTLTHEVTASNRAAALSALAEDPVNQQWQLDVAPFVDDTEADDTTDSGQHDVGQRDVGQLIWDFDWPTR
jgi:L-rhamnose mutarotase